MIKAYKGFNKDLTCTMGNGKYQYHEGVWIKEKEANCGANGLHCCYNPLDVLHYYSDFDKHVFYLVAADGDIHEDGVNTRISCTKMKLVKKLPVLEFVVHAMAYMYDHPHLKCNSNVHRDCFYGETQSRFCIVRGKNPICAAPAGTVVGMAKEAPDSEEITDMTVYIVDDKLYMSNVPYCVTGQEAKEAG